jgi:hypothetical protein
MTAQGTPTVETKAQMEFYYDKLKWAHGEAWWKVASEYAQGEKWPSVNELKQSLSMINQQFVKAIADTPTRDWTPMPEEVRQQLARLGIVPKTKQRDA